MGEAEKEAAVVKVVASHAAIEAATATYRQDLRAAIAAGVKRGRLEAELRLSGEKIRLDSMPADEREAIRVADAERKRRKRPGATDTKDS